MSAAAWLSLVDAASQPYRATSRWAYHWARGKLGHDPVFCGMLSRGDLPASARVVDIGCGQGLEGLLRLEGLALGVEILGRGEGGLHGRPRQAHAARRGLVGG